jgi:hypothetical protein
MAEIAAEIAAGGGFAGEIERFQGDGLFSGWVLPPA